MPETAHQLTLSLETHRNHYLFSDHYLNELLPRQAVWREAEAKVQQALEAITAKYREVADALPHYNEAAAEQEWIRPVLDILGHVYHVQPSLPGAAGTPDYAFFADETVKGAATPRLGTAAFWEATLAVGDAKRWDRPLDKRILDGAPNAFTNANPCYQIDYYLRRTGCTWGLVSNGRRWRLYHRDSSYRLDAFYEVDLAQLIEQEDVAAFRYFYLFFRADAFRPDAEGRCWLDTVLAESMAYAVRVGDELTDRVYEALRLLAQGFLDYPGRVLDPATDLPHIHDACLILLYRLLFLFYAESRGLLPLDNPSYRGQYSLKAIKEDIATKLDTGVVFLPRKATLCDDLKTLSSIIYEGNQALGVPAYNGGLFDPRKHSFLEEHIIGDHYLAQAIDLLARAETGQRQGLSFVDYRDLSIRHLGSIYEGLLEYRLQIAEGELQEADDGLQVELVTERGERKATGSYYTPDYIVKYIVEQTLGPLADAQAEAVEKEVKALRARNRGAARQTKAYQDELARLQNSFADRILPLNILDPAMGSGHFLVEATDYLARRIVEAGVVSKALVNGDEESELSYWRRRVVERCIYGVDLNPLAVELAKLSLWLATVAQGKPLSFLDHHLRCGNSLIGAKVADLQAMPVQKKGRKKEAEPQQLALWDESAFTQDMFRVVGAMQQIQEYESADLVTVQEKERIFAETVERERRKWRDIADLWTASYFGLELTPELYNACVQYAQGKPVLLQAAQAEALLAQAHQVWEDKRFFHWEIEFPEVFFDRHGRHKGEAAGFDAVVGNPPYVTTGELRRTDRAIWRYYKNRFVSASSGKFDIYLPFLEGAWQLVKSPMGRSAYILPNKWLKSDAGSEIRSLLAEEQAVESILDFGASQVFRDASGEGPTTYTCICTLSKLPKDSFGYAEVGEPWKGLITAQWSTVHFERMGEAPWNTQFGFWGRMSGEMVQELQSLVSVFVGTTTNADPVFILQVIGERGNILQVYSPEEDRVIEIEKDICIPFLRGKDIGRFAVTNSDTIVLFPYVQGQSSAKLIDESQMVNEYSLAWAYLNRNRRKLEDRENGRWRGRDDWYCHAYPRNHGFIQKRKLLTPDICNRGTFCLDDAGRYHCLNTVYGVAAPVEGYALEYLLSILNSRLFESFIRASSVDLRGGYYRVTKNFMGPFPVRRIEFTTPPEERERLVEAGITEATEFIEHTEGAASVSSVTFSAFSDSKLGRWLDARLSSEPEQADVVHDILAHLAGRMIEMHKQKQAEAKSFLGWLADYTGLPVDDWALKTYLRQYYEHDWAEMQRILKRNQRKLPNVDLDVDAYRNEPAQKIRQAWETSMETLRPLLTHIEATDRLIDRIVYQLYGLTEEEIAIVERQG